MALSFEDLRLTILRGDRERGRIDRHSATISGVVHACEVSFPKKVCMVTADSPLTHKKAVQVLARCWQRELGYDFVPFDAWEYQKRDSAGRNFDYRKTVATDADTRSFLWYEGRLRKWQTIGGF